MTSIVPQPIDPADLAEQIEMLDSGEAFDEIATRRWLMAAEDGAWTLDELKWAVRRLNLNHAGYVKIAHVHKQIEERRSRLRIARMYCWQHPNAIDIIATHVRGPVDTVRAEHFWQDYRYEWLNKGIADAVLATQTDSEWVRWVEAEYRNFRSEA